MAGAASGLAGIKIEKLTIGRAQFSWSLFNLPNDSVKLLPGNFAASQKSGERFVRDRAGEENPGIVRRGARRLIHESDAAAQGGKFSRPNRQVAAAQGPGAPEINARQLIVRRPRQGRVERGDAVDHGLFLAGQAARVEIGDPLFLIGRREQRSDDENAEQEPEHPRAWTKRRLKTNWGAASAAHPAMLFEKKWRNPDRKIIAFTTHKAGSMVLHRVLKDICELNRIRYYSPNESKTALPFDRIFAGHDFIARRRGCFGPLRFFVPTTALDEARLILHLRDPRDVLVSMFYSYCFMHAGEIERHTGYRKAVAEAGIDKFVLDMVSEAFYGYRGDYGIGSRYKEHVGTVLDRYRRYLDEVFPRPNTIVLSYEEMVLAFPNWLGKVIAAFPLANPEETRAVVEARHANTVAAGEQEDVWAHKRKVTPGDHREKLQPQTIRRLDEIFAPVLEKLGYSGSEYARTGIPVPTR